MAATENVALPAAAGDRDGAVMEGVFEIASKRFQRFFLKKLVKFRCPATGACSRLQAVNHLPIGLALFGQRYALDRNDDERFGNIRAVCGAYGMLALRDAHYRP